jgi:A/G-specific adenine glycosylase
MDMIDDTNQIAAFQEIVWEQYRQQGRHALPWRLADSNGFDPYRIMVSEIMLQQTQVTRVVPKYEAFLETFPTVQSLAQAELGAVLRLWAGLGYNRRAKFLHQAAVVIVDQHQGVFPQTLPALIALPGIGANTAGAILAYAYNQPVVFIETNIRTVYIHHFFNDEIGISDAALRPFIEASIDYEHPREWYWALMDYGSQLKLTVGNLSRQSAQYVKQSTFKGSQRQVRGQVIRLLGARSHSATELAQLIPDERLDAVLEALVFEGLVRKTAEGYTL